MMETDDQPFELSSIPADSVGEALPKICGNCVHFEPYRDSATGRVHRTKAGKCGWKPDFKWPMAYRRSGYGNREQDPLLFPVAIWHHTNAETCVCFCGK